MTKTTKPTIRIHNAQTDEVIDREMTDAEFAEFTAQNQSLEIERTEAESKAARRQEILDKLGLTNDEAQLLLG